MNEGTVRAERVLVRAVVLFRIGGLIQVALAVATAHDRYQSFPAALGLALVVTAESIVFSLLCLRRQRIPVGWLLADTAFCVVALVVGAGLATPVDGHTWAHFMYPFTIVTSVAIGLGLRRPVWVAAATIVLAAAYATSAVVLHHDPVWNVMPNALTYPANIAVAWLIARTQLRTAGQLDDSRTRQGPRTRRRTTTHPILQAAARQRAPDPGNPGAQHTDQRPRIPRTGGS